jgi:hypothetical protein
VSVECTHSTWPCPCLHPKPPPTPIGNNNDASVVVPFLHPPPLPLLCTCLHHPLTPSHPCPLSPHPPLPCLHPSSIPTTKLNCHVILGHMTSEQFCCLHFRKPMSNQFLHCSCCVFMVCICATIHFLRRGGSDPEIHLEGEYRSETTYIPSRRYLHIHGCTPVQ